jgi:DMSO/TMAO reductase YedYZ molybdopterin-dependent catalytic subunit
MKAKHPKAAPSPEAAVDKKIKRRHFISFTGFFLFSGAAVAAWEWLYHSPEETPGITGGTRRPLRRALNKTELFFRRFFSNNHHVITYPPSMAATHVRVNGDIGLDEEDFDAASWRLEISRDGSDTLRIGLKEITALPKTGIVFSFKCVEGWDQIQHWAGVRFTDFIEHFGLQEQAKKAYTGLETPDGKYYVGIDRESMLHPQTLLAYEMNNQPLLPEHGAPLRLIIPVKYGIKNLKRIGKITFSNKRPRDYWAEQGYDYYSGL